MSAHPAQVVGAAHPEPAEEAGWDTAPGLAEGARNTDLTVDRCDLNYWIRNVAQGTWSGLVNGHRPEAETPAHMKRPGPLRDAMIHEMAFRSLAEAIAARVLSYLVIHAPDRNTMEFYVTQVADEARHSSVFRGHLLEMGIAEADLPEIIERYAGEGRDTVLKPLEDWILGVMRDDQDFVGGVVCITILVEGVLAPAAEISELKWRLLDPAAAQIEWGANIDEIRHLTVGASIVRKAIERNPAEKDRLLEVIRRGVALWNEVPTDDVILQREHLFQQGMAEFGDLLADYELLPGVRLLDTTPEQRMEIAYERQRELQRSRLGYMHLEEAEQYLL